MSVQSGFSINKYYHEHMFSKFDQAQELLKKAERGDSHIKVNDELSGFKPMPKEMAEKARAAHEEFYKRSNVHVRDQVTISQDAQEAAARYQAAKQKGINAEAMGDLIIDPTASHEQRIDSINNFGSTRFESGMHTTTKNGTVIGVYTAPLNDESTHTKYVQIT